MKEDWRCRRDLVSRGSHLTGLRINPISQDQVGVLVAVGEDLICGIKGRVSWSVTGCADGLLEGEFAGGLIDFENSDAVVAKI